MLKEFKSVRQHESEYRRLFWDEAFELYVFYNHEGAEMSGFQLVHNGSPEARVVAWNSMNGLNYYRVKDDDEVLFNRAPILVPAGRSDVKDITKDFSDRAGEIDKDVFDSVIGLLEKYKFTISD